MLLLALTRGYLSYFKLLQFCGLHHADADGFGRASAETMLTCLRLLRAGVGVLFSASWRQTIS
jgi:hypothetical protein